MTNITFCVCTYNRGDNLKRLLPEMLRQSCVKPFEVLVVDNNSTDNTSDVVQNIAKNESRLRYVFEPKQGIVPARNRAIEESLSHDYLVFIDDDELPKDGFLQAALDGLESEGADCVGGKIKNLWAFWPRLIILMCHSGIRINPGRYGPRTLAIKHPYL